jgi:hypothetical protein
VTKLVLEHCDHARFGGHGSIELFLKYGLSHFEIVVEVREDGVEGDLVIARSVPVIHVGFEALPRAVAIESKAIVERNESKWPHPFGKVGPQAPEKVGCELRIVTDDAVLIAIEGVVGGKRWR